MATMVSCTSNGLCTALEAQVPEGPWRPCGQPVAAWHWPAHCVTCNKAAWRPLSRLLRARWPPVCPISVCCS